MDQNSQTPYQVTETPAATTPQNNFSDNSQSPAPPTPRPTKTFSKKLLLMGGIGLAVIILLIAGLNWYFHLPINQLKKALNDENISLAVQVYHSNASDTAFSEKALSEFADYVADEEAQYMEHSIEYEAANANLNAVAEIQDVADALQRIDAVEASRQSFVKAEDAFNKKDFKAAISSYQKVVEADTDNYQIAQEKSQEAISLLTEAALNDADAALAENDYAKAYDVLSALSDIGMSETAQNKLDEICSKSNQLIEAKVQEFLNTDDYIGAYKYICTWPAKMLSDETKTLKSSLLDQFLTNALSAAKSKADVGDYKGAIQILTDANSKHSHAKLTNQIAEYQLEDAKVHPEVSVTSLRVSKFYISNQAFVSLKNNTDKVVKDVLIGVLTFDSNGYPCYKSYEYSNLSRCSAEAVNIQPGATWGGDSYWNVAGNTAYIKACVISVDYYDAPSWENPYFDTWLEQESARYDTTA